MLKNETLTTLPQKKFKLQFRISRSLVWKISMSAASLWDYQVSLNLKQVRSRLSNQMISKNCKLVVRYFLTNCISIELIEGLMLNELKERSLVFSLLPIAKPPTSSPWTWPWSTSRPYISALPMSNFLPNQHWDSTSRPKARNRAKTVIAWKLVHFWDLTLCVRN